MASLSCGSNKVGQMEEFQVERVTGVWKPPPPAERNSDLPIGVVHRWQPQAEGINESTS
jgi:hypothetical protein